MNFGSPLFLWFLLAIPVFIGLFILYSQWRQKSLLKFASSELIKRLIPPKITQRQIIKWTFFLLFLFFAIIALARPRFGIKMQIAERKGVDIIVALDISQSMLAEDVVPSRLEKAKYEISKFIDLLKGDRIGIIVFAGESFVQCPLTLDYGAAKMFLDAISTDWIRVQGTAIADAIYKAIEAFKTQPHKSKVLLIISDGEDHLGNIENAVQKAVANNIRIHVVGIGSQNGAPIPIKKSGGSVEYKKDANGNMVITRLNSMMLEKISIEGKGKYFHSGTNLDMTAIYNEISKMEKNEFGLDRLNVFEEQYQIFLFIALLFLLAEFFFPQTTKSNNFLKGKNNENIN
jgi:Ca-activated chloride channel family protein